MSDHLFFWGHRPERDGSIGKGCLSQWWPATFTVDGHRFASAEHYMMWRKAELFADADTATRVLASTDPREAKALGRAVRGFDAPTWEAARYPIVLTGSVAKFSQHPDLRAYLLSTAPATLVEASPDDRVWGIGLPASDPRAQSPSTWRGLNLLGKAHTETRDALLADSPPP